MLIAEQRSALSGFTYDLVEADGSVTGELVRRSSWFKTRFELQRDGQALGQVHEPDAFTTRRRLCAELPADVLPPVQGFLLFLVINPAFG